MTSYQTREEWLNAFVAASRPHFDRIGKPLPERVRVSVGFTSHGARGNRIGECWHDEASEDGYFEIFLKPSIKGESRMADILTHELCHAAAGLDAGHGKGFKTVATRLGLGGKMTSTIATSEWYKWALPILSELGPMPYGVLDSDARSTAKPKQSTNLLKVQCDCCGFTARVTAKWISGCTMRCPDSDCDGNFEVEN